MAAQLAPGNLNCSDSGVGVSQALGSLSPADLQRGLCCWEEDLESLWVSQMLPLFYTGDLLWLQPLEATSYFGFLPYTQQDWLLKASICTSAIHCGAEPEGGPCMHRALPPPCWGPGYRLLWAREILQCREGPVSAVPGLRNTRLPWKHLGWCRGIDSVRSSLFPIPDKKGMRREVKNSLQPCS